MSSFVLWFICILELDPWNCIWWVHFEMWKTQECMFELCVTLLLSIMLVTNLLHYSTCLNLHWTQLNSISWAWIELTWTEWMSCMMFRTHEKVLCAKVYVCVILGVIRVNEVAATQGRGITDKRTTDNLGCCLQDRSSCLRSIVFVGDTRRPLRIRSFSLSLSLSLSFSLCVNSFARTHLGDREPPSLCLSSSPWNSKP
jgi:hypothetical protein